MRQKSSLAPSHDFDHIVEFSLFVVDNIFDVSACIKDTNNRHATFIFIYEVKSCVVIYGNPAYSHRMPRLPLYKRMAHLRERIVFLMRLTCFSAVLGTCKVKRIYSYNSLRSRNACGE